MSSSSLCGDVWRYTSLICEIVVNKGRAAEASVYEFFLMEAQLQCLSVSFGGDGYSISVSHSKRKCGL